MWAHITLLLNVLPFTSLLLTSSLPLSSIYHPDKPWPNHSSLMHVPPNLPSHWIDQRHICSPGARPGPAVRGRLRALPGVLHKPERPPALPAQQSGDGRFPLLGLLFPFHTLLCLASWGPVQTLLLFQMAKTT